MVGQLFLVTTPIGNLSDMTFRAVETLKNVDLIGAEDTRQTIKLLNHFEIKTPMTSYHEHNKIEAGERLIELMKEGKNIGLVTDAGTPGISDPGEELVKRCVEENITVISIPGAVAAITALVISGLPTRRFVFEGFLPADKKEQREVIALLKHEHRTIIFYEAPHRIEKTLEVLKAGLGNRKIAIGRELTKRYEEVIRGTIEDVLSYLERQPIKGEMVVIVEGEDLKSQKEEKRVHFLEMTLADHMKLYEEQGLSNKDAMKAVAKDRGVSKSDVYKALLNE